MHKPWNALTDILSKGIIAEQERVRLICPCNKVDFNYLN